MDNIKLSQENIIKLINLYRSHPLLWDLSSKSYRRKDLKIKAYENIANEMHMPVEVIKMKIRNLRTTYTAKKRKIKTKTSDPGAEEQYTSTLQWYNEMSFLDKFIVIRKNCDYPMEYTSNSKNCKEEELEYDEDFVKTQSRKPEFSKNYGNKNPTGDTASDRINEILERVINESETDYTAFGASIAQQLANMSVEHAYELMNEIQSAITQRKLKELRQNRIQRVTAFSDTASSSSNHHMYSSTASPNILRTNVTDIKNDFDSDNETILS